MFGRQFTGDTFRLAGRTHSQNQGISNKKRNGGDKLDVGDLSDKDRQELTKTQDQQQGSSLTCYHLHNLVLLKTIFPMMVCLQ